MDAWNTIEAELIPVGDRTMRVRRRIRGRGRLTIGLVLLALLVAAGAVVVAVVSLSNGPAGLAALPSPAVVAPGGFRANVNGTTITVGLEIRNVTEVDVTVSAARIVAPSGLTSEELTLISPGARNQGFALDGPLPPVQPITLGTNATERNGIVAARFAVDCDRLATGPGPTGEQIFVTVRLGGEEREEALTSPVVGGTLWLAATARRACAAPTTTGPPPSPLPALPEPTGAA